MTDSPSETSPDTLAAFTENLAALVGADSWTADNATVRIVVSRDSWVDTLRTARDAGLEFFSWLSAVDWSRDVAVGDPVADEDALTERYEVVARVSSVTDATAAHFAASVPKDDAWIDSVIAVFGGAGWHEREAAEMFGIDFRGHPNLTKLYLPDGFEGFPLRKSFPLLSREVKPWPGDVDVEAMPSTENVEAGES